MGLYWSDIWVLQALNSCTGEGSLDLPALIAVADGINHAILTSEEFNNAVYRLELANLIVVAEKTITLSESAQELFRKYARQSVRKQSGSLEKRLRAITYSASYDPHQLVAPREFVSKGRFNRAVQQYVRKFGI